MLVSCVTNDTHRGEGIVGLQKLDTFYSSAMAGYINTSRITLYVWYVRMMSAILCVPPTYIKRRRKKHHIIMAYGGGMIKKITEYNVKENEEKNIIYSYTVHK